MDHKKSIQELKEKAKKFSEDRDWDQFHSPKELAIGISTEAAELLQLFRFKTDEQMKEMFNNKQTHQEIKEELADVLHFVLRFAQLYDIDLTTEFCNKLQKGEEKYPVEKSKGKNHKYTEF